MKAQIIFGKSVSGKVLMKIIKVIVLVLVVFVLLAIVLVPVYVSSGSARQMILSKVNESGAGKMDFASLSMGWLKGLTVREFSFNDLSGMTQVKIKQITTKPHYGSLLMGGLSFGKTVIEQPRIELNLMDQKPAEVKAEQQGSKPAEPVLLPVSRIDLVVEDGDIKVTDKRSTAAAAETVELSNINSKLNLRPPGSKSEFAMNMMLAQAGKESKIAVEGNVTPSRAGWSLDGTSGGLELDIKDLDLEMLAPLLAMAGVDVQARGKLSAKIAGGIDNGQIQTIDGVIKAKDLAITGSALRGDRLTTKVLDVNVKLKGEKHFLKIEELRAASDWLNANAAGVIPVTKKAFEEFLKADSVYHLKADFDCDIGRIFAQMPHVLSVREGMKITSGSLKGNIETFTETGRKGLRAQVNLTGLTGEVDGKQVTLPGEIKLDSQVVSDKGVVTFDKLNVDAPFASVKGSGTMESVKYSIAANLSQLQEQLGQFISFGKYKMAGQLSSDGQVSVKKEKIIATGTVGIKDLRLSSTDGITAVEPAAAVNFGVDYDKDKKIVAVDTLKVAAGFGQLDVKDAVLPLGKNAAVPMKLAASALNIDLAKLQPFMVLFASFPKDMQLAGIVQSQVSVTSKKDTYRITTDATSIKNLKVNYPAQQPFEQAEVLLVLDVEANPVLQTLAVKKLQLTSPQIKIKGNFEKTIEGSEGKLDGQANLEYDWAAVSTIAAPYLPKGLQIKGKRADTIKFSSKYPKAQPDKMLANLNAKAKVGFDQANYMGLVFGPTEVEIWAQNGMLIIPPFSAAVNSGQLNFAAEADFKQKPTFVKTPSPIHIVKDIQITEQMGKELMTYVNPLFANNSSVTGTVNFNCEKFALPIVGGTKNDIEIIGTIAADNVKLGSSGLLGQLMIAAGDKFGGEVITMHPTKFTLQQGFLRYDNMQIDVGQKPFIFKGAVGLDETLNMMVTLPYGGGVTVPLRGTVSKPKPDLGKLFENIAKKQLEGELKKSLEGLFKK